MVIVRSVVNQGMPAAQVAARFGVTRQWVYTLLRRYEADGPDGLAPRSRAPHSQPGKTVDAVRAEGVKSGETVSVIGSV